MSRLLAKLYDIGNRTSSRLRDKKTAKSKNRTDRDIVESLKPGFCLKKEGVTFDIT